MLPGLAWASTFAAEWREAGVDGDRHARDELLRPQVDRLLERGLRRGVKPV